MADIIEIFNAEPVNEIYLNRAILGLLVIGLIVLFSGLLRARARALGGGVLCVFLSLLAIAHSADSKEARLVDQCETVAQLFEVGKAETSKENKLIYLQQCGQPKYTEVFDIRLAE